MPTKHELEQEIDFLEAKVVHLQENVIPSIVKTIEEYLREPNPYNTYSLKEKLRQVNQKLRGFSCNCCAQK